VSDSPAIGSFEKILQDSGISDSLEGLDVTCRAFENSMKVDVGEPFNSIDIAEDAINADVWKARVRAISLHEKDLRFDYNLCIRCFCCIEICPYGALHKGESFPGRVIRKIIAYRLNVFKGERQKSYQANALSIRSIASLSLLSGTVRDIRIYPSPYWPYAVPAATTIAALSKRRLVNSREDIPPGTGAQR
jgi:ferredoxin